MNEKQSNLINGFLANVEVFLKEENPMFKENVARAMTLSRATITQALKGIIDALQTTIKQ